VYLSSLRLLTALAAEADDNYAQVRGGYSVSNCDVPCSAATTPWNKSETMMRLLSELRRPNGSLMEGKPTLDKAHYIKSLTTLWRWERPGFRLQDSAWDPRVLTDAPQTQ